MGMSGSEGFNGDEGKEVGKVARGVKRNFEEMLGDQGGLDLNSVGIGSVEEGGEGEGKRISLVEDGAEERIGVAGTGVEELGLLERRGDESFNGNVDELGVEVNGGGVGDKIVDEEFDRGKDWGLGLRLGESYEKGNVGKIEMLGMDDLVTKFDFDLNEPYQDEEHEGSGFFQEIDYAGKIVDKGKGKAIDNGFFQEIKHGLDLSWGITERHSDVSGSIAGGRRYTREEKGKAKVDESSLSVETGLREIEFFPLRPNVMEPVVSQISEDARIAENLRRLRDEWPDERPEDPEERALRWRAAVERVLGRPSSQPREPPKKTVIKIQEPEIPPIKSLAELENFPGPFSSSLKEIRERNAVRTAQEFIMWKPSEHKNSYPFIPSLLELCLRDLVKNSEALTSLDHVPGWLRQRFTAMLCDARKMSSHILNLLLIDSPTEIRITDCSWITEAQAGMMSEKLDGKNLRVLKLDLLGKRAIEDILHKSLVQSTDNLMCLRIVSLRGACRLSDDLLRSLVTSAPQLQSINVGQSTLITEKGIKILADSLATSLRELYIDYCQQIDAILALESLKKFQYLEVLSVAGIESVSDDFVIQLSASCGSNMKELDLANCGKLTDASMEVIGKYCSELESLNISHLNRLTDFGLLHLANGCLLIRILKCVRNEFSDEAIAAFIEVSGKSLEELSLNGVKKVGPNTALSLARYSRNLSSLDLSWCRKISNEALGLIVDCCFSLKLLKIFGMTQISEIFLKGHSNRLVQIVGTNLTPVLAHVRMFQSKEEVMLRFSSFRDTI